MPARPLSHLAVGARSRRARSWRQWLFAGALPAVLAVLGACERGSAGGTPPPSPSPSRSTTTTTSGAAPASSASTRSAPEPAPDVRSLCERFADVSVPDSDLPTDAQRLDLRGCDAEALYYGIDTAVDFVRARQCAFVELGLAGAQAGGGPEILTMIYGNGRGVPTSLDLALRFACSSFGSGAELEARLQRIWQARARSEPHLSPPLDVCAPVAGGEVSDYCAALRERLAAVERKARKQRATAGIPAPLGPFEAAAKRYFDDHVRLELEHLGTEREHARLEEQAKLEDELVDMLEQLRDPSFTPPAKSPKPFEAQLTALLSRISSCRDLAELERIVSGGVTRAGIRKTQASFVAYRSAFVNLAHAVRPDVAQDAWLAWLDEKRLNQLRELGADC